MSLMPMENGGLLGGSWETGLLGQNPLLNIGLGILANNTGNYGRAGPAIGRGAAQGMQQTQQALHAAAAQKMMKAQMEEMEEERKRRRGTTDALSKAYTPAGNMANMSFMDANNAAMAGENPDFQINQTPASFDINRALPEIMQVNPELGMQLYQQEQERQRQEQERKRQEDFYKQIPQLLGSGGAGWEQQAGLGVIGSLSGIKGAGTLLDLAKLNKPDPSVDLNAAQYFDKTGQYPPGYVPPQGSQQSQSGNLPTNNFGRPVTWSGADFGAPGTTQEDVNAGITSEADINVLNPKNGRKVTGPLITPMPPGLSPEQQRQFRLDEAKANIQTPKDKADLDKLNREKEEAERKKQIQIEKADEAIRLIDEMIGSEDGKVPEHPGMRLAVGGSSLLGIQKIPGRESYAFMTRLKQLQGKTFLESFQELKGGGSITEVEGQKAEQAMARIDNASTEEEFIKASRELQDILRKGRERAKQGAGYEANATTKNETTATKPRKYNPKTGRIE